MGQTQCMTGVGARLHCTAALSLQWPVSGGAALYPPAARAGAFPQLGLPAVALLAACCPCVKQRRRGDALLAYCLPDSMLCWLACACAHATAPVHGAHAAPCSAPCATRTCAALQAVGKPVLAITDVALRMGVACARSGGCSSMRPAASAACPPTAGQRCAAASSRRSLVQSAAEVVPPSMTSGVSVRKAAALREVQRGGSGG